ncbi:MAG: carboxypeptidase M32 [Candidatus Lokiarchaeota archaeon]|nr:carboxypeptidase M32 [Candidatus Lokiarchaeota archaeon]
MGKLHAYKQLIQRMKNIKHYEGIYSLLAWDVKTYMPDSGIMQRSEELGLISKRVHELFTSKETGNLLKEAKKTDDLNLFQERNLELIERDYKRETKIPTDLVEKISKHESHTEHLWEKAKAKSNFEMIKNDLQKMIELKREKATAINPDKDPYDILLDLYEPNITQKDITTYFTDLKEGVIKLVHRCSECQDQPDLTVLKTHVSNETQKKISSYIIKFVGLDPKRSRIDESEHPFTTGYGDDVRITTHYLNNDPMGSFYSVLHEAGHALYELDLPREHFLTPIGNAVSFGIHESQSRFIENIIGKGDAFLSRTFPLLQSWIPAFENISYNSFLKAVNAVIPSKIRIYADEVTYNLHIILRFEIERDIFAGKCSIDELPEVWNQKMAKYLDQDIQEDKNGVLQDTHWYGGAFGYFPAYALGNIYDGQFLQKMEQDIPEWEDKIKNKDEKEILDWLKYNIHEKGFLYDPRDLLENVTSEKPNAKYFVEYLNKKFKKIYKF